MALPFRIIPVRREEVLRRSAMQNPSPEEEQLYEEIRKTAEALLDYKITERNRPFSILEEDSLKETLAGCDAVIIFTARLGEAFREMTEEAGEPETAILRRGLAAERLDALVESYLDHKEKMLREAGAILTPHYPYAWEGVPEDAATTTRIVGINFHPGEGGLSRCRSCFAENCPARRESPS